jgi:stage II sporulation protein D
VVAGFHLKLSSFASGERLPELKVAETEKLSEWEFRCETGGKIRARDRKSDQTFTLSKPIHLESAAGMLRVNERIYRETVVVHALTLPDGTAACEAINHVDLEKYLVGLVNSEFSAEWAESAIDAQVIAARTYAYHQIRQARRKSESTYDLDATIRDQVYDGTHREDPRSQLSIQRTRGLILIPEAEKSWVLRGGEAEPLKAYYHSTCGGRTILPEAVWGKKDRGFERTAFCGFCKPSPRYTWQVDLPRSQIEERIRAGALQGNGESGWPLGWRDVIRRAKLKLVQIGKRDSEGRAEVIRLKFQDSQASHLFSVKASRFRYWIGTSEMKSTWFEVKDLGRRVLLEGRGFGHGVGMCQWGAKVMGEKGHPSFKILSRYYPDAIVVKAW